MREFVEPSKEAVELNKETLFRSKYHLPFDTVPLGKSFAVNKSEGIPIGSLRTSASRQGKKLNRVFRVIDHGETFEVHYARDREVIAPPVGTAPEVEAPVKKPLQDWIKLTCPNCNETNGSLPVEEFLRETADPAIVETRCMDCDHVWQQPRAQFEE